MNKAKLYIIVSLLLVSSTLYSQISLPKLIGEGMVLQRNTEVKIWGWASVNEKIAINFLDKTFETVANSKGEWSILLPKQKAGGPYKMELKASNEIYVDSIYFGDVWLCSGQSNMELTMERVSPVYKNEIANANHKEIRYFHVPREYEFNEERNDLSQGNWIGITPKSVLKFSAVSYFYALELYNKYKVPIGLINNALGGSPVECWLSEEALKEFPEHYDVMQKFKSLALIDSIIKSDKKRAADWRNLLNSKDEAYKNPQGFWDNNWQNITFPDYWPEKHNGSFWFRKEIELNPSQAGKEANLNLGAIVDADSVFVNGVFVGRTTYRYPPRRYIIPEGVLREGKNLITIRVISKIEQGGFIKDKPYELLIGSTQIDLKGKWQYKVGSKMEALQPQTFIRWQPGGLFNAMVAPIKNYKLKGVIWYQGESNVGRSNEYKESFPRMMQCWRSTWAIENLPFIYVQLANYLEPNNEPTESKWAELREAQTEGLKIPNTAMACAIDLGEWNDIHPLNKKDIAKRLALGAYRYAYNETNTIYSGPTFKSMKIQGNKVILSFSNCGSGLVSEGGKLREFAIAGKDKRFVWANTEIKGNDIIVWSDKIKDPVAVRYAWANNPEKANLYNQEGLPAIPFRTDRW